MAAADPGVPVRPVPTSLLSILFLLAVGLSGCAGGAPEHRLSGSFTAERTDGDIQEVVALGRQHGGAVAILESFPEQFVVSGLSADACASLRDELSAKTYLSSLGACRTQEQATGYGPSNG